MDITGVGKTAGSNWPKDYHLCGQNSTVSYWYYANGNEYLSSEAIALGSVHEARAVQQL